MATLAVGLVWLTATPQGAAWLVASASSLSRGAFSADVVSGRLCDRLLLQGVRLSLGERRLEAGRLELRWKPELLLTGTLGLQELHLERVRIRDDAPDDGATPDLAWPRMPAWSRLLDVMVARLRVTDLVYRRLRHEPLRLDSLSCFLEWRDERLSLEKLVLDVPTGRLEGSLAVGFGAPELRADLLAGLKTPVAEMNRFRLRLEPGPRDKGEELCARLSLTGGMADAGRVALTGELGMTPVGFNLRRLRLERPGRRGSLSADGSLTLKAPRPLLSLRLRLKELDLAPELHLATSLSGTLDLAGTPEAYQGRFNLANQGEGWRRVRLSGVCRGTGHDLRLAELNGSLLDGALSGRLDLEWRDGLLLAGELSGRGLNPARISPEWKGSLNLALSGRVARSAGGRPSGRVSASLLESRLHGQTLTGELRAALVDGDLGLERLLLAGNGFDLRGSGRLSRRIDLLARVRDLSRLIPGASGSCGGEGWLALKRGRVSGAMTARGNGLDWGGMHADRAGLDARLEDGDGFPLRLDASLEGVRRAALKLAAARLRVRGTLARHDLEASLGSAGNGARLGLVAGYGNGVWQGNLTRLEGRDGTGAWNLAAPARFSVASGRFLLAPLRLVAGPSEFLHISADLRGTPLTGQLHAQWGDLNLARSSLFLADARLSGTSSGTLTLGLLPGERLSLEARAAARGNLALRGASLAFPRLRLDLTGGQGGVAARLELDTERDGRLRGSFSSSAPLGRALPERGTLAAQLERIDLALLAPWLPAGTGAEGLISGRVTGETMAGQRFRLDGSALLSGGTLRRATPDGELRLLFRSAELSWGWQGEELTGQLSLAMERHGQLRAGFRLPVAARLPLAPRGGDPLSVSLTGRLQEQGILAALFPGMVRETGGELDLACQVNGSWDDPRLEGRLNLERAGAYLPSAGIRLKDVRLAARLERDLILIESLHAGSGAGRVSATARIALAGWRVSSLSGTVRGENFQTVNVPELRLLTSPELRFEGTPQRISVRGELRIPELRIADSSSRTRISPSSDVVREGRSAPESATPSPLLDARVRVVLGERVSVRASGIDASLGGSMDLTMNGLEQITSSGEIRVTKGRFRTYGVNLEIVRGRLFFTGGPIHRPTLDFLALRTVGDVRAGVTVTGTLQRPVTRLYSEPTMQDSDILAYVVLGRPLGGDSGQTGLMAKAAGALLGSSQASVLLDQVKEYLGLSSLEIQDGLGTNGSTMGYRPLQGTLGESATTSQSSVAETTLSVGKYLTPQLYVSYGRSLFSGSNLFRLRYDIFRNWQIETQTGSESSVDLYYKLEFR